MKPITVVKRDGSKEVFSTDKIIKILKALSMSETNISIIMNRMSDWVDTTKKQEITSLEIRDALLPAIAEIDEYAANMFTWYQNQKGK